MHYTVQTPAGNYIVLPDVNLEKELEIICMDESCVISNLLLFAHSQPLQPSVKVVLKPVQTKTQKIDPIDSDGDLPMDNKGNVGTGIKQVPAQDTVSEEI